MGLLDEGQSFLNEVLGDSEGRLVTYSRTVKGQTKSVELTRVRLGRTVFAGLTESGAAVMYGEKDYLIEVAELAFDLVPTTPHRGDRIAEGGETWEVASPATDEPAWRYSDQTRTLYRVHCKRVDAT